MKLVKRCEALHSTQATILKPKTHQLVKHGIRPKKKSSGIYEVDGRTLESREARSVWPKILASQTSWYGPQPVSEILRGTERRNPGFDDEAAHLAAKACKVATVEVARN